VASPRTDGLTSAAPAPATPAQRVGSVVAAMRPKSVTVVGDESSLTTALLAHGLTVEPHDRTTPVSTELVVVSPAAGQVDDALAMLGADVARVLMWRAEEGSLGELVSEAATRGYFRSAEQPSIDGVTCVLLDAGERTLPQLVAHYEALLSNQPILERKLRELHHQVLTGRDHAIGAEAEIAQLGIRFHEQERRIAEIRASTTWRVGLKIVGPLGKLKRVLGR
jgi:hypothetical protein